MWGVNIVDAHEAAMSNEVHVIVKTVTEDVNLAVNPENVAEIENAEDANVAGLMEDVDVQ